MAIPFDAELLEAYRAVRDADSAPMSVERLPAVRAEDADDVPALDELRRGGRFEVVTRSVPGGADAPAVELLICTPVSGSSSSSGSGSAAVPGSATVSGSGSGSDSAAARPAIYFVHGGGYFSGDQRHRFFLDPLLDEAERLGASVISVGYRLAPEHPYPTPHDDVYAGLLWTADHAAELGVDPERIVVAGTSAGGGLAAAVDRAAAVAVRRGLWSVVCGL